MSEQGRLLRSRIGNREPGTATGNGSRFPVPRSRVVAVGSGKGGAGTSTLAALLAITMAEHGRRVLLVDAGERLGALHLLLGVEPARPLGALRGGNVEPEDLLVPVAPSLMLLPGEVAPAGASLSTAERRLLFRRVVSLYDRFDLVVVDAGATLDTMLTVCADGVTRFLAVTATDRLSIVATYALVKALHLKFPQVEIEIVANRHTDEGALRTFDHLRLAASHFLDFPVFFAGAVPDDAPPDFAGALAAGMDVHEAATGSSAAVAVREIGERLLAALEVSPSHRSGAALRIQP
jgi:flagellar biosynthesis protein FlhG